MTKKRVAVLISGRGSNLQALLDAKQDAYEIVVVVSNVPDAAGLERARAAGVEALTLDRKQHGKTAKRSSVNSTPCSTRAMSISSPSPALCEC
jgi:folate-dependent phosphoribosylglycinamide formyltransferase PurN